MPMKPAKIQHDDIEERAVARLSRSPARFENVAALRPDDAPPEVVLIRGDTIKPEPIRWLWDGWLARGKLHILAGSPGTGKSTIAFALAAAVTAGRCWPDGTLAPTGDVLIWSGEDDPADTITPRLMAAGADLSRVHLVSHTLHKGESRFFDPATDMDALKMAAACLSGDVALLIADPIVSAVTGDSHKNTEVRRALQPLVDLGAMLGCAVLGISHFSKGTGGRNPVERVTGSIAFSALARIVLATAKPEEGPRILARAKSNIGPDCDGFEYAIGLADIGAGIVASRVEWGSPIVGNARELLGAAEEAPEPEEPDADPTPRDQAADWLREVLSAGPISTREMKALCAANGIAWRTAHRARESIGAVTRREGTGRDNRMVWALEEHDSDPETDVMPARADGFVPDPLHSDTVAQWHSGTVAQSPDEPEGTDTDDYEDL
jgi:hypothetical protein